MPMLMDSRIQNGAGAFLRGHREPRVALPLFCTVWSVCPGFTGRTGDELKSSLSTGVRRGVRMAMQVKSEQRDLADDLCRG